MIELRTTKSGLLSLKHAPDAGLDIWSKDRHTLPDGTSKKIYSGVFVDHLPEPYRFFICTKSGQAAKKVVVAGLSASDAPVIELEAQIPQGLIVLGGVIDSGYTSEIVVMLMNLSSRPVVVEPGGPLAQLVLLPGGSWPQLATINGEKIVPKVTKARQKDGGVHRSGGQNE